VPGCVHTDLIESPLKREVSLQGKKIIIHLESLNFAKDVYLALPGYKGRFSDDFFDMMPGKKYMLEFLTTEEIDIARFKETLKIIHDPASSFSQLALL